MLDLGHDDLRIGEKTLNANINRRGWAMLGQKQNATKTQSSYS
jgi:hypothetical protein